MLKNIKTRITKSSAYERIVRAISARLSRATKDDNFCQYPKDEPPAKLRPANNNYSRDVAMKIIEVVPIYRLWGLWLYDACLTLQASPELLHISAIHHFGKDWRSRIEKDFGIPIEEIEQALRWGYRIVVSETAVILVHDDGNIPFHGIREARQYLIDIIEPGKAW